jgi:hypothetical protein
MESDAKRALDQKCQTRSGPTFCHEAEIAGAAIEPFENALDMLFDKLRRPATTGFGRKACFSVQTKVSTPATDTAPADSEKICNVLLKPSFGASEHGQQTYLLQH